MIDHVYVLLKVNDFGEIEAEVYQHRANAIYQSVLAMVELGIPLENIVTTRREHALGVDLWAKAKHGPAQVTVLREVPR